MASSLGVAAVVLQSDNGGRFTNNRVKQEMVGDFRMGVDEDDDGLHGGRMKPLSSLSVNRMGTSQCSRKPLTPLRKGSKRDSSVRSGCKRTSDCCYKENVEPSFARESKKRAIPNEGAKSSSMDLLFMALDTCSGIETDDVEVAAGALPVDLEDGEETHSEASNNLSVSKSEKRKKALEALKRWKHICKLRSQISGKRSADDRVLETQISQRCVRQRTSQFESLHTDELPLLDSLTNRNGSTAATCLTPTQEMEELPLLQRAAASEQQTLMSDSGRDNVSLMLRMGSSEAGSRKPEKSGCSYLKQPTSATDLFLGPCNSDPVYCQDARSLQKLRQTNGAKRITLTSAEKARGGGGEEMVEDFKPGIMSRIRDGRKVRAILGAVVGSTIVNNTEDDEEQQMNNSTQETTNECSQSTQAHTLPMTRPGFISAAANVAANWLELLNLDLKGRIAALKRSRRRVRGVIVSGQFGSRKTTCKQQSITNVKKEQDMHMDKWMTLFMNMDSSLAAEGNKLERWMKKVQEMQKHCLNSPERVHELHQQFQESAAPAPAPAAPADSMRWHAVCASAASICSTANMAIHHHHHHLHAAL